MQNVITGKTDGTLTSLIRQDDVVKEDKYGVVLLCGGKGSRLRDLTKDSVPKPLFKVADKELIRYSIDLFDTSFVDKLIFAVDYKANSIISWVENINLPYKIEFSTQPAPGVLEAIKEASSHVDGSKFIFCNSDEIRLDLDIRDAVKTHEGSGLLATVIGGYTAGLYREAVLDLSNGKDKTVVSVRFRDESYRQSPEVIGLVAAGLVIARKESVALFDSRYGINWEGILKPLVEMEQLGIYISKDMKYFNANTAEQVYAAEATILR